MARRHNTAHAPSSGQRHVIDVRGDIAPPAPIADALTPEEKAAAAGWCKGQLLNVRNAGSHYNVTLLGEEYDPRRPERCIQFTQPNDCQNFVSQWYGSEGVSRPPWG